MHGGATTAPRRFIPESLPGSMADNSPCGVIRMGCDYIRPGLVKPKLIFSYLSEVIMR